MRDIDRERRNSAGGRNEVPRFRRAVRFCAAALLLVAWLAALPVAAEQRVYDEDPHDLIYLLSKKDGPLEVCPLDCFPDRKLPDPLPKQGKFTARLLENPTTEYEIQWRFVEKIELFEQRVLAEADRLVAEGKFDEAYEYFAHLKETMPKTPGLEEGVEHFLFQQAKALASQKREANALAILNELYRRNPKFEHLDEQLGAATEAQIDTYMAAGKPRAARELLRHLSEKFPKQAAVAKWQERWKEEAGQLLGKARGEFEAGHLAVAEEVCRQAVETWPAVAGGKDLAKAIHEKYARVVVGVTSASAELQPGSLNDWAARRSSRLVYRTLVEFLGPGTDGGKYRCPVGDLEIGELGRRLVFRLKPNQHWSRGDSTLTGPVLARRLLAIADPHDEAYQPQWAELLERVSVPSVYEVNADLTRFNVRPQAFLQTRLLPYGDPLLSQEKQWWNGPYVMESQADNQTVYVLNSASPLTTAGQPKKLVEQFFNRGSRAIEALKRRDIDVLDRVDPWLVDELKRERGVVVKPYGVPLVHCLIPNLQKPLMSQRTFRRALAYGINREAILERLCGGRLPSDGSQVISGPFSAGTSLQDPLAYAYDETLEPRGYDPRLALSLVEVARRELAQKGDAEQWKTLPPLVLAHPEGESASVACAMIQRQLRLLGLDVKLKALPPQACTVVPDDVDLLYAELAMWEPIADARRLLGAEGPSRSCSSYMALAIRQLEQTTDWREAGSRLRQIHRIAYDDIAVVPLWQLVDYFAYGQSLEGIGERPVSLYQDIEAWKPAFYYPLESP